MPRERILILGGTGEARELAGLLQARGCDIVTSLAGVTSDPELPAGEVRRGGFGGVEGLVGFVQREAITAIADITHPFAATISAHASAAADLTGAAYVRFDRPAWQPEAGDRWQAVPDTAAAVAALPPAAVAFVTIGRKELALFTVRVDLKVVARTIEPPEFEVPQGWRIVLARPPFTAAEEEALMRDEGIEVLVTKNSGGSVLAPKLAAARALGLPVVMIERPDKPDAVTATSVAVLADLISPRR